MKRTTKEKAPDPEEVVARIRNALDNIRSDEVSYDYLDNLVKDVERLKQGEVIAIAERFHALETARTKKAALQEIRLFLRNQKQIAVGTRF